MEKRSELKGNIVLWGESDGGLFSRTFTVHRVIQRGASAISYEASHKGSGIGVLKEFYPRWAEGVERNPSGQLTCSEAWACARFHDAQEEYLAPYRQLLSLRQKEEGRALAAFLPPFELYRGGADCGGLKAAYLWTPEPKLETFEHICQEIRRRPRSRPEYALVLILNAIRSLTQCIQILHAAGLVHRDINPSNFGFVKRGDEPLTQSISLFDINTICSVYKSYREIVGTPGYMEPEAGRAPASNQTDLYAIGATLFQAVVIPGPGETAELDWRIEPEKLRRLVDTSQLIQASEANSHPRLRGTLIRILRRCLCTRDSRYADCEELLEDLNTALYYALPSGMAEKNRGEERWVLANMKRALDVRSARSVTAALQDHLYRQPLFRWCGSEGTLRVLIIGFGGWGQKFLDLCLQVGQIPRRNLEVRLASDEPEDWSFYLEERPALPDFFAVDGSPAGRAEEPYGRISFQTVKLAREDRAQNAAVLRELLAPCGNEPCYVLIALGADKFNQQAAVACRQAAKALRLKCCISYAWEGEPDTASRGRGLYPVCLASKLRDDLGDQLERMAFNVHLVWQKDQDVDSRAVRAAFLKRYNHDSCISHALSLKYKLYSVGIDLEALGPEESARRFAAVGLEDGALKNQLICAEHRRWVTEKLCAGWRRLEPLTDCLRVGTRCEQEKRHVCMVTSRPDQKLAENFSGQKLSKWDQGQEELEELDELDRMSVELHRLYMKQAETARQQSLFPSAALEELQSRLSGSAEAVPLLQEWSACARELWNGERNKVTLYRGRLDALLQTVRQLSGTESAVLTAQIQALDAIFAPAVAAMEYRDYKQDDIALVEQIPYLLTYTQAISLAVPLSLGDNTAVFANVAAAAVVDPERLILLDWLEEEVWDEKRKEALSYLSAYLDKKRLRARVELLVVQTQKGKDQDVSLLEKELNSCTAGRVRKVRWLHVADSQQLVPALLHQLNLRRGKGVLALERNCTQLSAFLQGAGFYEHFPCYRFDCAGLRFIHTKDCDLFRYISRKPSIQVSDLSAFRRSRSMRSCQPEFFSDYQRLWRQYRAMTPTWKQMCQILREHSEKQDVIAVFSRPAAGGGAPATYRYLLPASCGAGAGKVLDALVRAGTAAGDSRVSGLTTGSCEVVVSDQWVQREPYDQLFSRPWMLLEKESLKICPDTRTHRVRVCFDNLQVRNVQIDPTRREAILKLLNFFAGIGYLSGLCVRDGGVDFTYATRAVKQLLTTAGRMLEVYVYHKAKETGQFDDVVSGLELEWKQAGAANEFDCVLTLGFTSLFVECKARAELDQEFYYKISELTRRFGINARAVLVADTRECRFYDSAARNQTQRERGAQMGVITIWDQKEIDDIGNTLLRVIQGDYVPKEWEENHVHT